MKQQTARSISLGSILWVTGMLAMAAGTGKPAHAATIHYVVHNNGGLYDLGAPGHLGVEGKFTFDTETNHISNFRVTFTGESAIAGLYVDTSHPYVNYADGQPQIVFEGPSFQRPLVRIGLNLSGLGDFGPYEIVEGYRLVSGDTHGLLPEDAKNRPAIVGVLGEPPATVPEPSSWAMSLLGLAGLGVWIRQRSSLRR